MYLKRCSTCCQLLTVYHVMVPRTRSSLVELLAFLSNVSVSPRGQHKEQHDTSCVRRRQKGQPLLSPKLYPRVEEEGVEGTSARAGALEHRPLRGWNDLRVDNKLAPFVSTHSSNAFEHKRWTLEFDTLRRVSRDKCSLLRSHPLVIPTMQSSMF